MKNKKIAMLCMTVMLALGLTGCAENQIPDMTDEQMQEIGEYVGITLIKYDASHRSRLVELSDEDEPFVPEPTAEPQKPAGMDPVEDTPVIDMTDKGESDAPVESVLEFAEGMTLTYTGQEVCDYYPKADADSYLSINAAEGKKLLILNFNLSNHSAQAQDVDLLSSPAKFKIKVNGSNTKWALTTMLDNDLSTYVGTLPANQSVEVVLIIEVPNETATSISTIELKVENESASSTIKVL